MLIDFLCLQIKVTQTYHLERKTFSNPSVCNSFHKEQKISTFHKSTIVLSHISNLNSKFKLFFKWFDFKINISEINVKLLIWENHPHLSICVSAR